MLAALRAQRAHPKLQPALTPAGPTTQQVHTKLEREREEKIAHGEESLRSALERMREDYQTARLSGYAKTHFQQASKEIKP